MSVSKNNQQLFTDEEGKNSELTPFDPDKINSVGVFGDWHKNLQFALEQVHGYGPNSSTHCPQT